MINILVRTIGAAIFACAVLLLPACAPVPPAKAEEALSRLDHDLDRLEGAITTGRAVTDAALSERLVSEDVAARIHAALDLVQRKVAQARAALRLGDILLAKELARRAEKDLAEASPAEPVTAPAAGVQGQ
jgi:hypothetical protein